MPPTIPGNGANDGTFFAVRYEDNKHSYVHPQEGIWEYTGFTGAPSFVKQADGTYAIAGINLGISRTCSQNGLCSNSFISKVITQDDIKNIQNTLDAAVSPEMGSMFSDATVKDLQAVDPSFVSTFTTTAAAAARDATALCQKRGYIGGFLAPALDTQSTSLRLHCTSLTDSSLPLPIQPAIHEETIPIKNAIAQWGAGATIQSVSWAKANRVAHDYCVANGYVGGHFTGAEDTTDGTYTVDCYIPAYASYREIEFVDIYLKRLGIDSLDTAPWWVANSMATGLCQENSGDDKRISGFFTGHRSGITGKYGLVCVGVNWGGG